ncbi:MAG TPA: WbqC family protein [Anseongella sp.]|nr:WbqC family protein [Anseongella sp.]
MCYLPPVSWFWAYLKGGGGETLLERQEHFPRQTYRNRCHIYSPNGLLALSVPVQKGSGEHTAVKDVRISGHHPWQKIHWRSLEAAYRSSAFFEFYEDELAPFYEKRFDFLYDFNEQLLQLILQWMKVRLPYAYTAVYVKEYPSPAADYRHRIHPKKPPVFTPEPYYQVFADRNGYLPDLSVIDLLFNFGNKSAAMIIE